MIYVSYEFLINSFKNIIHKVLFSKLFSPIQPITDYTLNSIDLCSTSTDRNQALTLTLTDTLRSISLERLRGSFDETESVTGIVGSNNNNIGDVNMENSEEGNEGNYDSGGGVNSGGNRDQADFIRLLLAEQENDEEEDDEVYAFIFVFVLVYC